MWSAEGIEADTELTRGKRRWQIHIPGARSIPAAGKGILAPQAAHIFLKFQFMKVGQKLYKFIQLLYGFNLL